MKCFILSAGFGKRMGDLTLNLPKPLLLIGEYSLLQITIARAYLFGFRDFFFNVHFHAEKIILEIKKCKHIESHISIEKPDILGTAGGIKTAIHNKVKANENICVINPDSIFFPDIKFQLDKNYKGKALLYLSGKNVNDSFTGLSLIHDLVHFKEGNFYYNGLSILNTSILEKTNINKYSDLSDIFKNLANENTLGGKIFQGMVVDVGEKKKYLEFDPKILNKDFNLINTIRFLFH